MGIWQSVSELVDGQSVSAETFNKPIGELAARTEYLKNLLDRLVNDEGRGAITVPVDLVSSDTPSAGDIVCVDPGTGLYRKAVASMSLYDAYTASEKAFALGMLVSRDSEALSGLAVLYGRVNLKDINVLDLLDREDGAFVGGQYYLSSTVPGKITRFPNGPRILVGYFSAFSQKNGAYIGREAFINPQHMDIESHAHRTYTLLPRPCGESVVLETDDAGCPTSGDGTAPGVVTVIGYAPDEVEGAGNDIPRMEVCGDWTADFAENYKITVSDGRGNTPLSWPCSVEWRCLESSETGSGELGFFGDSVAVGSQGLRVRLSPYPGMPEGAPFQFEVPESQRTWSVGRWSGCGWADAGVHERIDTEDGVSVRLGGVSNQFSNHLEVRIPRKVFNLTDTAAISEVSPGDTLVVDGDLYKFVRGDEGVSEDDPEDTEYIQIVETVPAEGVPFDTYDTMANLAQARSGVLFDEELRQVLADADEVEFNGSPLNPVVSNTGESVLPLVAMVSYTSGKSLAPWLQLEGSSLRLSLLRADAQAVFSVSRLKNGLTAMFTKAATTAGAIALADVYCVPGARFRYNIEFDNDLKLHFPPVPARSGCLMLNGVEVESYGNYGDRAVVAIGDDSIYWRDATETRQPWPLPEMRQSDRVDPQDEYRELFHFVSEFHSETGPVTSLHPAEGSPITVRRCGTDEDASVGDLELDVDLTLGMVDGDTPGFKVPKASRGGKMLLGPVVERLVAGPGISFSRKAGMPEGQGTFTISADGSQYAGDFETLALENAKLESVGMFPYIRLLKWDPSSDSNIPTGFVAKFHVPATATDAVYRVRFYATVFGETSFSGDAFQTAGVRMEYNILPDYTGIGESILETANLKTGVIQPDPDKVATLDIPFGHMDEGADVAYSAYDPLLVHNDPTLGSLAGKSVLVMDHAFPTAAECSGYISRNNLVGGVFGVRPGYTVAVRFSRTSPTTGTPYTGAIGFLNLRWAIEEVAAIQTDSEGCRQVDELVEQTVRNLRRAAAGAGPMGSGYEVVHVLTRVLNALR